MTDKELFYEILVNKNKPGNCKRVFFVCFSFAQRQSGKIRNQERINNNGINTFNNIFRVGWLIVNAMAEIPPFLSLNEMEE